VNLENKTAFTDIDHALEEVQFLVEKDKISYSIIRVRNQHGQKIYVVPTDIVVEVEIIETFKAVPHGTGT
jgi:hypothetical protein